MRTLRSLLVFALIAVSAAPFSHLKAALAENATEQKPLAEFLRGTKWYWEGSKEHILEFCQDGTAQLNWWKLPTDWKVTGPNEAAFTMHFPNEPDKTATITFTDDRTSFSGTQFRGGVISKSPRADDLDGDDGHRPLARFLGGTKWYWEGSKQHILEFRRDGRAHLDYWTLPTDWRVTGRNEVTFTMHFKTENKSAIVHFTDDRSSFSGTQFRGGVIANSPRVPGNGPR
jgi:hypothetical protein